MKQYKCKFCGKTILENSCICENVINHKNKNYYCNEICKKKYKDKIKYKPSKKNKDGTDNQRRILLDYVQSVYLNKGYNKSEINWEMICSQISKLLKEHSDWRYSGITYTLHYMMDIKEINLFADGFNGSILNLVQYEYENAKRYYATMQNIKHEIESSKIDDKIVVVKKNIKETDKFILN